MKGEGNEIGCESLRLNSLQQFPAFLQPRHRVGGALEVADHAALIHYDGGGALDADEVLYEFKAMIESTFRIGQDRERRFERLCIPAGRQRVDAVHRRASQHTPRPADSPP